MISPSTPTARGIQNILAEDAGDALGDAGLAVARRSVKEQPPAGIDGRPQAVEHLPVEQQVGEGLGQVLGLGLLPGERLRRDAGNVVAQ